MAKQPKMTTMKRVYRERKSKGLCVSCGKEKAHSGHVEGPVCVAMNCAYAHCKRDKKAWSRENFMRTEAAKRALAGHYPDEK